MTENFHSEEILTQIVSMMHEDLTGYIDFNSTEPTYVGQPKYVANYPCLVSIPSSEGISINKVNCPHIGDTRVHVVIGYIFEGMSPSDYNFVDPSVLCIRYSDKMLDWIGWANFNNRFPLKDPDGEDTPTNWAIHMYDTPWTSRPYNNPYQNELSQYQNSENLYCPIVEFATLGRERIV
jgi:hypothetical protein